LSIILRNKNTKKFDFVPRCGNFNARHKVNLIDLKMNITISEIAEKVGLSRATVSKALNDKDDISPKTRKRIKKIAKEMGYSVNIAAQMLSIQKTKTIGVIVPFPQNPSVIERMKGIQLEALDAGYLSSMAFHDGNPENEIKQIKLLHGRVDGMIVTPFRQSEELKKTLSLCGLPLVFMSECLFGVEADYVGNDDEEAGRIAAMHLIEKGHVNIAYLGSTPDTYSDQKLLEGFKQASKSHLCDILPFWGCTNRISTLKNMEAILRRKERITAIFAFSDHTALWAMDFFARKELGSSERIALVGCDDIEFSSMERISLTSISQPNLEIGKQAAKMLLEHLINPEEVMSSRRIIFPPTLKPRQSSD